jgi:hypothetical protein
MVVGAVPDTILPGSGRPGDCLEGGMSRHVATYDGTYNCWCFQTNNESNDDANSFRYDYWSNFSSISRYNFGYNQLFRSRYS